MLFNSFQFIFIFLPITLYIFYLLRKYINNDLSIIFLVVASLIFYAYWKYQYVYLLIISIILNYTCGNLINKSRYKKVYLIAGLIFNLGLLGYFKYTNFLLEIFNSVDNQNYHRLDIVLPLAISFFTFQQISFLVDSYKGITRESRFIHYCLFVTFFPQLIAGPIVHHKEMLPQFDKLGKYNKNDCTKNITIGLSIFVLGLFKKVLIADGVALYATPVFNAAEHGHVLTFLDAWIGVLAYTFQIYFDFSGYSDMALGLARMFGIILPLNFYSPYKARNIIEFWRRWHMTLSRFLRDYIYIPLGGNRHGVSRRYINIMLTMLLGGIWHGAGWTFIIWGLLHGVYIVINNLWIFLCKTNVYFKKCQDAIPGFLFLLVTFFSVVLAWVPFRTESFNGMLNMYKAMFGANGILLPSYFKHKLVSLVPVLQDFGIVFGKVKYYAGEAQVFYYLVLFFIIWFLPNVQQVFCKYNPSLETEKRIYKEESESMLVWSPKLTWSLVLGVIAAICINSLNKVSEFLYFQF